MLELGAALFAYPSSANSDLQSHLTTGDISPLDIWASTKELVVNQIKDSRIGVAMQQHLLVKIVTRRGHVLEGVVEHFDEYEVHLKVGGQTVIVYRHGLHKFEEQEPRRFQWNDMIQNRKKQPFRFLCKTGAIELFDIQSSRTNAGPQVSGIDGDGDTRSLTGNDIFFTYSVKVESNEDDSEIWEQLQAPELLQILELTKGSEIADVASTLWWAMDKNNTRRLQVITHAGHVIQGKLKTIDDDALYMDVKERAVIVFKHGLCRIHAITPGRFYVCKRTL